MRIVVDTNVFVLSFFGGNPRRVIGLWKTGIVTLCLSQHIVDEYFRVLTRLGLDAEPEFNEIVRLFARAPNILFTRMTKPLNVVVADPDDNKCVECAVALRASCIVSGDAGVLAVRRYLNIDMLSPRDFLERLGRTEHT